MLQPITSQSLCPSSKVYRENFDSLPAPRTFYFGEFRSTGPVWEICSA